MNDIERTVKLFLDEHTEESSVYLVAVSGGMDSMALLYIMCKLNKERVIVAHVNHGIRGEESNRDEEFVKKYCERIGIPCVVGIVNVPEFSMEKKISLEEGARVLRYQFLEETRLSNKCDYIVTAHHADDNLETVFFNLIRGTGLLGLTGIHAVKGKIIRPLLDVSREEIVAYVEANNISFVEDSTNSDPEFSCRNKLRLELVPLIKQINPQAVKNVSNTIRILSEADEDLNDKTKSIISKVQFNSESAKIQLVDLTCLSRHTASRVILRMIESLTHSYKDIGSTHVDAVLDIAFKSSNEGKTVSLPYNLRAEILHDQLIIKTIEDQLDDQEIQLGVPICFGDWEIKVVLYQSILSNEWKSFSIPKDIKLVVTTWRSSDWMQVSAREGNQSFKRICSNRRLTIEQRDRVPVLRIGDQPIAIPFGINLNYRPEGKLVKLAIKFSRNINV